MYSSVYTQTQARGRSLHRRVLIKGAYICMIQNMYVFVCVVMCICVYACIYLYLCLYLYKSVHV